MESIKEMRLESAWLHFTERQKVSHSNDLSRFIYLANGLGLQYEAICQKDQKMNIY